MEIGNLLQPIGDKVGKIMVPNSIFQDLMSIKVAIGLIAVTLLLTSFALFVLALPHHKSQKIFKLIESNPHQIACLPRQTHKTK